MPQNSIQTVLVTGAEGALGRVVAEKFAQAGARVLGTHAPGLVGSLPPLSGEWISVDLSQAGSRSELGKLSPDAVIHCAGGFRFASVENTSEADLEFLLNSNLKSAFHVAQATLPGMRKRGFGRMVFISSKATAAPTAGVSAYAAAKAGINMLVGALTEETRGLDITVNAVMPSIIDTPANRAAMPGSDFSTWVSCEELAAIIHRLTQDESRSVRGALIPVTGKV